jgi:hypothetical protein
MDAGADEVFGDLDAIHRHGMKLAAEGPMVSRREPGIVFQDDLGECSLQENLGGHGGHGGIDENGGRRVDPPGTGHGVVVQQSHQLATGMA